MPKFTFDPPTVTVKDIPTILLGLFVLFAAGAVMAEFIRERWMQNVPFWQAYVSFMLSIAIGGHFYYLILRPLRGMPPLFRKRATDDFETWPVGSGFKWSRLRERYSTDELILVFGVQLVLTFAGLFFAIRL